MDDTPPDSLDEHRVSSGKASHNRETSKIMRGWQQLKLPTMGKVNRTSSRRSPPGSGGGIAKSNANASNGDGKKSEVRSRSAPRRKRSSGIKSISAVKLGTTSPKPKIRGLSNIETTFLCDLALINIPGQDIPQLVDDEGIRAWQGRHSMSPIQVMSNRYRLEEGEMESSGKAKFTSFNSRLSMP
eukprot:jgi/Bigna1/133643/aug1.22_g8351